MIESLIVWSRRFWPFVTVSSLATAIVAVWMNCHGAPPSEALQVAHQQTVAADTVFVRDTLVLAPARAAYRARRDTVLRHLTDTVLVKETLARADTVIVRDSIALFAAVALIGRLRNEIAISEKLRAPRYQLATTAGLDVSMHAPVTGLESVVRLSERWSVVGRVEHRWAPGEPTRRLVMLRYTL